MCSELDEQKAQILSSIHISAQNPLEGLEINKILPESIKLSIKERYMNNIKFFKK